MSRDPHASQSQIRLVARLAALAGAWWVAVERARAAANRYLQTPAIPRGEALEGAARAVRANTGLRGLTPALHAVVEGAFGAAVERACALPPCRWDDARRVREAWSLHEQLGEVLAGNGSGRERTLGRRSILESAHAALANPMGRDRRNGGTITCGSYGYRWSTTDCTSVLEDGKVVAVSVERRNGVGSAEEDIDAQAVAVCSYEAALPGEIAVRSRAGDTWLRVRDGAVVGVAVPMPADLQAPYGAWEHGADREDCAREIERKRALRAERARAERLAKRDERAIRLLARLSAAPVGFAFARASGACRAGIAAWARARGVIPPDADDALAEISTATVPCHVLARDEDPFARRIAAAVATRLWAARTATRRAA